MQIHKKLAILCWIAAVVMILVAVVWGISLWVAAYHADSMQLAMRAKLTAAGCALVGALFVGLAEKLEKASRRH